MIQPGQDRLGDAQRYWRSQGNRRVRKKRMTRYVVRWSVIAVVHALLAGFLLVTVITAGRHLAKSSIFKLETIELSGAERAQADRIRTALRPLEGQNLFDLDLQQIGSIVRRDPWVESLTVRRVFPGTLRISVTECVPSALAVIGGVAHLVDTRGYVIGPTGPAISVDLPVLTGLESMDREQLIAALDRGVSSLESLRRVAPNFSDAISELNMSRQDRIIVRTVSPGPRLLLDPQQVARNVERYLLLEERIRSRVGGAEYVDLRWKNRISVMPAKS